METKNTEEDITVEEGLNRTMQYGNDEYENKINKDGQ